MTRGGASSSLSANAGRKVYVAVGSNLGNRFENIVDGINVLCNISSDDLKLVRTSYLIESAPMYVTDQPPFLNGVVEIETTLSPQELLERLKTVELNLGRNFSGIPNGPRPLDLDILLYDTDNNRSLVFKDSELQIPHPRLAEREFVLAPLLDLGTSQMVHPELNMTIIELLKQLKERSKQSVVRVLPLPRGRLLHFNETIVMGILNVTPDSFSDGGNYQGRIDLAVSQALKMVEHGAGIIDIGGESTRPGAKEIEIVEQLRRTVPVIKEIRKHSDVPLSIDTRHAPVAEAAIDAGADIVNDVSGGMFDEAMFATVAKLRVPMIVMHMRGTPETMQKFTKYDNIVDEVAAALQARSLQAERHGIQRWHQVLDPGIGFAKDLSGNLHLLRNLGKLQSMLGDLPIVLGTSRKGFIGEITGEVHAANRDFGSVASSLVALCLSDSWCRFNILRVHNVSGTKQATMVMDAIRDYSE